MDEELLQYYFNDEGEQFTNNDSEFETDIEDEDNSIVETEPTDLENRVNETVLTPDEYTPITSPNIGTPGESIPEVESPLAPIEVPDPTYKTETMTEIISLTEFDEEYLLELKENGFKFYANYTDGTKEEVPYTEVYDLIEANPGVITFTADSIGAASNQHFWNDGNGAHVSDNPKEDWEQNDTYIYDPVSNPVVDKIDDYYELSGTSYIKTTDKTIDDEKTYYVRVHTLSNLNDTNYHNILINSLGILLRKAYVNYAMFSRSNVAFFDGAGNDEENILAYFGAMSAQIGRSNSNHVVITSNGVTAYKGDGTLDELTAIVDGANLKNSTITGSKIASSTIENSNIKDGTITGAKIQGSTLTNIPYAEIDQLKTRNVTADAIQAATGFVASLATNSITAAKLVADQGIIDNLETNFAHIQNGVIDNANINVANVNGLSANYAHITNGVIDNAKIGHADVNGLSANYAHITNGTIDNAKIGHADVNGLSANYATIANLNVEKGRIDDLEADHVSTSDLAAETARINTLVANTADLNTIRANAAKVTNLTAAELEADHATVGSLDTNYAQIDMANVNNAWITNGTIKDAAISDGMINSVSANKLTAGTIDASNITVTNLNADNITTGTINGQRIGAGSLSLDKLSEDVYTETEVDSIVSNLQTQIDGAIETWTGTAIPTLQNAPASSWTTNSIKDTHVGDVYFIVNLQSNQNGYNYRFTKSGTGNNITYSWQLIKDSDVTNALQRLTTAEGKITTFDSDISQLKTDTGTLTTKTTNLETRMSDAEADILDKVDTTTFNEVSDTVDSHSQSITQMTTTLSNKADSSTVTSLTTRVSKNEQDISGINSTIGSLETAVESKADGSTVETISSKVNTISDTVDGHTQNISSIVSTQTQINHELDKSIVETVRLYTTRSNNDIPLLPTTPILSGTGSSDFYLDNTGNQILDSSNNPIGSEVWSITKPSYNLSKPNYFYCYQNKHADGSYTWSNVVRDNATTESQNLGHVTSENLSTVTTRVNNISDTVDGHTQSISNITSTQTTMQSKLDKTIVETTQLWFSKADTTAPNKPTAQVTSTSTAGNTWSVVVPAYNASYPNYYYCYQWKYSDGTYGWSSVTRDIATGESQERARTAITNAAAADTKAGNALSTAATAKSTADTANDNASTALSTANTAASDASDAKDDAAAAISTANTADSNASTALSTANTASSNASTAVSTANTAKSTADTAKATADKNVKESQQLWFTKSDSSAPDKPTVKVTSTAVTGNTWTTKVPTYNTSYPHYFYCMQYIAADGTVTWSDVVYDQATTEAQSVARTTSTNLSTLQQDYATFKQTTQQFESTVGTTYATKTELKTTDDKIENLESRVSNNETSITQTNNQIALKANASDVYTKTQTDGLISTEVSNRNSAINQKADAITASVASTYTTKTEFNNLEIGGRNLLSYSEMKEYIGGDLRNIGQYYSIMDDEIVATSQPLSGPLPGWKINNGKYIVSGTTSLSNVSVYVQGYDSSDQKVGSQRNAMKTVSSDRYFELTIDDLIPEGILYFYIGIGSTSVGDYTIKPKLEKGNKPTDWSPAPEDLEAYTDLQINSAKSEIKVTTDSIASEVSKISSAKYVASATASWSLPNIKTWSAEGYTGTWSITSSANLRVGDTVYIKGTDSTRNCSVYIKVTVTGITSNASITGISHGYEDVLPVETIKSTINQSSDSVKIQANHVDIEGAAIFSSGRLSSEALNGTYDKKGTAEKVVSDFDKQIIDKLDSSIIETIQLWTISSTSSNPAKPSTPIFINSELSDSYLDNSGNTILDSSGNVINSITWTTVKPSYNSTKPYYHYCYQYRHYDGSYTWSDVYKDNALSSAASESVSEEQYVYISKASGTNSVASNTTWVTVNSDSQNTWTTKRPTYNSSYPVLFVAKQRKTLSGVVTCTIPVKDDTTTVIDGGHITTGTIDASRVTVTNLDASEIKTGSLAADRIKANVISAVNNGTGTINADKINVSNLSIGYNQLIDTPTIPTKVSQLSNDSDFVNADQLSTVIDGQNSVSDRINESIVNTKILYITRDVSTIPDSPNTPIVLDSDVSSAYLDSSSNLLLDSNGNAIMSKTWTVFRPSYNQDEPYYFYCYQYEHSDGSYTWSNVMRDDATNESFKILSSRVEIVCSSINYSNSTASLLAKLYVNNVEMSGNQYQWFKDGVALANQTNQILTVTSSMGINHLYSCTVDY